MNKPTSRTAALDNIQAFLDDTRGQIIIGEIPPIRRGALECRDDETISELLQRLDASLGKAMSENTVVDGVLPEIKRRRRRKKIPVSVGAIGWPRNVMRSSKPVSAP